MPLEREVLEKELNILAEKARAVGGWGRKKWTRKTKQLMVRLGAQEGHQTCATKIDEATWGTEWLYDVVWLEATENFVVSDIALVAEIEWGNERDVWDDFQKLPLARAEVRVMIFDYRPGLQEALIQQARGFGKSKPDDRYLFASYRDGYFTVCEEPKRI